MNPTVMDNKIVQAARYGSAIKADESNNLPIRIEVMRAGSWPETSNKGMLYITPDDLQEFVNNFHAGIGVPGGKDFGQIPIDFSHNDYAEAAGWITDLSVENNILYANVTWTTAGEAALKGGMYKCFSPSFWPACLGEYPDPENWNETAKNVLVGGGLTNIPFFKDLTAIMASNAGNSKDSKTNVKAQKENIVPTLDEVRIKDVASLTDDDKKVLADNKSSLSADELKKFDLAEKKADAPVNSDSKAVTGISEEEKVVLASIKSGETTLVKASEFNALKQTVDALKASNEAHTQADAANFVKAHVARGAIKADQAEAWTNRIIADNSMKQILADMHGDPKLVGKEIGADDKGEQNNAAVTLDAKISEAMKADTSLTYSQALTKVVTADATLGNQHEAELKN